MCFTNDRLLNSDLRYIVGTPAMLHIKPLECTKNFTQILINIMGSGIRKMCIINDRLRDKKPLSQKLIVRSSRFHEFLIKPQSVISGCGPCTAPIRISRRARSVFSYDYGLILKYSKI